MTHLKIFKNFLSEYFPDGIFFGNNYMIYAIGMFGWKKKIPKMEVEMRVPKRYIISLSIFHFYLKIDTELNWHWYFSGKNLSIHTPKFRMKIQVKLQYSFEQNEKWTHIGIYKMFENWLNWVYREKKKKRKKAYSIETNALHPNIDLTWMIRTRTRTLQPIFF